MRALSILQPWALLVALGLKEIENRTWLTHYRGEFLIHAGKGYDGAGEMWLRNNWWKFGLPSKVADILEHTVPKAYDRGGIIGRVELVDCVLEHDSGWKAEGSYGFVLRNARQIPFIPYRGQQGFFEVPDSVITATTNARTVSA